MEEGGKAAIRPPRTHSLSWLSETVIYLDTRPEMGSFHCPVYNVYGGSIPYYTNDEARATFLYTPTPANNCCRNLTMFLTKCPVENTVCYYSYSATISFPFKGVTYVRYGNFLQGEKERFNGSEEGRKCFGKKKEFSSSFLRGENAFAVAHTKTVISSQQI